MRFFARVFFVFTAAVAATLSATADDQAADTPEARLAAMGITVPEISSPIANYVKVVRTGNLLFLAGHLECSDPLKGKLGADLTIEAGYASAERIAICLIATLKAELGSLDKVKQIVRLSGMVNSTPDFTDQSKVVNGASDMMVKVFGDKGRHARMAVGMASLPLGAAAEISLIVEVE